MNAIVSQLPAQLTSRTAVLIGIGAAVFLGVLAMASVFSRPDMARLYSGLDAETSGEVVAALEQMDARVTVTSDGDILAPERDVARLRMALAAQGLPQAGGQGYELFDDRRSLGLTSFMQTINRARALEGELARSILSLDAVEAARVHLVLPERDAFAREPAAPTASVVVRTRRADGLPPEHAAAIRHLVASAAPRLEPTAVTVLDARHGVISAPGGSGGPGAAASDARRQVEADLRQAVERMLAPVVGAGNIRVEIAAELVTAREVVREEVFDPRGGALRSEQTIEQLEDARERGETGAVTVEQNLPEPDIDESADAASASSSERLEQTRNYEISSTIRERVLEPGDVKRLTAAVIVNQSAVSVEGGGVDQAMLARIDTLVKAAIGFETGRGDTVEVAPMPFAAPLIAPESTGVSVVQIAAQRADDIAKWLAFAVVGGILIIIVGRPLMARLAPTLDPLEPVLEPETPALTAADTGDGVTTEDGAPGLAAPDDGGLKALPTPSIEETLDQMMDVRAVEGKVRASSLQKLGHIVEENPDEVVAIIRSWIYEEAA